MKNSIRSILTFVVLFVAQINVYTQCKYEKNEIDKFTNLVSIVTKSEIIVREAVVSMGFALTQNGSQMGVRLGLNLQKVFSVSEGAKLIIKTQSGLIELPAVKYVLSSGYSEIDYNLSAENYDLLKAAEITDIRIELSDEVVDGSIDVKKAQKIKALFSCIALN
jgi:hypothetical protein